MAKGKPHFVAKSGINECLPGFVAWAYKESPLLDLVADIHGMTENQRQSLKDRWMVTLHPTLNAGADYALLDRCNCTSPQCHTET